jgi:PadR family transcriptional regulator PadR
LTHAPGGSIIELSEDDMSKPQTEVPYGTLDLLVLKTLDTMGTLHGYAISRRIEQVCGDDMQLSQGSVYPALIRLQQEGWIRNDWGISETNRKVKFYSITAAGRKQLRVEVAKWEKATALVARFLEAKS